MSHHYHTAQFLLSANAPEQFPDDEGYEVAFVGRSNCGKSTTLNALTRQKSLARVSKTPGRTQLINFFSLDEQRRLVDLPGYGYAKVSREKSQHWMQLLDHYCQERFALKGIILLMDIRHPLTPLDEVLLDWCLATGMPLHILLNKADKLGYGEAKNVFFRVKKEIDRLIPANHDMEWNLQLFSATKKQGLDELYALLNKWFNIAA